MTGTAAGGTYLKVTDIVGIFLMTVLLCMKIMPLDAARRLVIVMGCSACFFFLGIIGSWWYHSFKRS